MRRFFFCFLCLCVFFVVVFDVFFEHVLCFVLCLCFFLLEKRWPKDGKQEKGH